MRKIPVKRPKMLSVNSLLIISPRNISIKQFTLKKKIKVPPPSLNEMSIPSLKAFTLLSNPERCFVKFGTRLLHFVCNDA